MTDSKITKLLEWVKNTQDETLQPSTHTFISPSIEVKNIADFGRGIHAASDIKKSQQLIRIPHSFLLNFTTVVRHITRYSSVKLTDPMYAHIYVPYHKNEDTFTNVYGELSLPELLDLSSFQIISLFLTFESQRSSSFWKPFIDSLPEITDFTLTPLIWQVLQVNQYEKLLKLLPKSTKDHADKVYQRFISDFDTVKSLLSSKSSFVPEMLPLNHFLWAWMCINSRCLYMEIPQGKNNADNFTMAPYVDFINHSSDDQCRLKIDTMGFQVITTTAYNTNDQVFLSYGPHSNEFLLCEYGFILPNENKWNDLNLSDTIISLLKPNQIEFLKQHDYYDDYTINIESGISFRTEVALAVLQEESPEKSTRISSLINGYIDGAIYKKNANILLTTMFQNIIHDCDAKLRLEYSDERDKVTNDRLRAIGTLYRNRKQIAEKYIVEL